MSIKPINIKEISLCTLNEYKNKMIWYAIRVSYSQEMKVKAILDDEGIENFIPMIYEEKKIEKKVIQYATPVIHNLIFIHTFPKTMKEIKATGKASEYIKYMIDKSTHKPMIVPERQMNDFILIAKNSERGTTYFDSSLMALKKGDKVRVIKGPLKGVVGDFIRIKRRFHIVITIANMLSVVSVDILPSMVEKIK